MRAQRLKVPSVAALGGLLVLAACGGDAESANDDASRPLSLDVAEAPAALGPQEAPAGVRPDADPPVETAGDATAPAGSPEGAASDPAPSNTPSSSADPAPSATPAPVATPRPAPRRPTPRPAAEPAPRDAAPEPAPAPRPEPVRPTVAAGTRMGLVLSGELSTERNAVGDPFEAAVVEDVLAADGMVLVPAGTRVLGRVVESRESPSSEEPAVLALAVDALVLHGRTVPVRASVLDVEVEAGRRDSDARTAAKVGAGAAAGAVVGRILGKDAKATLKGAVAGAVAGGAVAAVTRDAHAVIRDGARILVRIDQALVVDQDH